MIKTGPLAASARDAALAYAAISPAMAGHFYSTLYGGGGAMPPVPHLHRFQDYDVCVRVRVCVCVCVCMCVYVCGDANVYVCMRVCYKDLSGVRLGVCVCVCVCGGNVCVYLCIYV
jgi:hypothetical protein